MTFVCLAAGRGRRMRPLTRYVHKAMIPFFGLPFLEYSIRHLPERARVVMIVGHLSDQITGYFKSRYAGHQISYLKQSGFRGTGDALFQFWQTYGPTGPIVVWQADQFIFPENAHQIVAAEPNAILCSRRDGELREIGLWKVKPATLGKMRSCFSRGEYRALPVIEQEPFTIVQTPRRKIELSIDQWEAVQQTCAKYKRQFRIASR